MQTKVWVLYQSNQSFNILSWGMPWVFDIFTIWWEMEFDDQCLLGGGEIWSPWIGGGRILTIASISFYVSQCFAWVELIMADMAWKHFCGKHCGFRFANWLWSKSLHKPCAVFEGTFFFLRFKIICFDYMNILSCGYS